MHLLSRIVDNIASYPICKFRHPWVYDWTQVSRNRSVRYGFIPSVFLAHGYIKAPPFPLTDGYPDEKRWFDKVAASLAAEHEDSHSRQTLRQET